MAKKMKRMSKEELRAPDQVEVALRTTWERLSDHRNKLLGALAVVIVAGVGLSVWQSSKRADTQARAEALRKAMAPLNAPIGPPDPAVDPATTVPLERFDTREAALAAAEERLSAFLQAHGDAPDALPARFARASALLGQKKAAEAAKELEAVVAEAGDSALRAPALEKLAQAYVLSGDRAKAVETYTKLVDGSKGTLRALALIALGDLHHPLVVQGGDVAQARKYYDEAKTVLGPKPATDPNDIFAQFSEPAIYAELDRKLSTLP